jgi:hypothetical protein
MIYDEVTPMKEISELSIKYISLQIALGESPRLVDCIDSLWSVFEKIKGQSRLISQEEARVVAEKIISRGLLGDNYGIAEIADCLVMFSVVRESISQLSVLNGKWTEDRVEQILSNVSGQVLDNREGLLGLRHRIRLVGRYWLMELQEKSVNTACSDVTGIADTYLDSRSGRMNLEDQAKSDSARHDKNAITIQRKCIIHTEWKPPFIVEESEIEELIAKRDQGLYKIWAREPMGEYFRARMRLVRAPERRLARLAKEVLRNCHAEHIPLLQAYKKLWPKESRVSITAVLGVRSDIRKAFWELRQLFKGYPSVTLNYDEPYPRAVIKKNFSYCLIEPAWENSGLNVTYNKSSDYHPPFLTST